MFKVTKYFELVLRQVHIQNFQKYRAHILNVQVILLLLFQDYGLNDLFLVGFMKSL